MVLTIRHSTDHCNSQDLYRPPNIITLSFVPSPFSAAVNPTWNARENYCPRATWLLLHTGANTFNLIFALCALLNVICFWEKKLPLRSLSIEEGLDFFLIFFEWCQNGFSDRMVSALIRDGLMMGRFGHTLGLSISWRRRRFFEDRRWRGREAASNPKWFIFWLICI